MKYLVLLLTGFLAFNAEAEVYKCTDSGGNKVYRSTPCVAGSNIQIDLKTGVSIDLDAEKKSDLQKIKERQEREEQAELQRQQAVQRKQQIVEAGKKNQALIKSRPHDFSAYAIPPYDVDNLLPLVKRFEGRLVDIERLRGAAAEKALATGQCNRVESSELNEKSSPESLVFLVDCSNAKTFYFNEQELDK